MGDLATDELIKYCRQWGDGLSLNGIDIQRFADRLQSLNDLVDSVEHVLEYENHNVRDCTLEDLSNAMNEALDLISKHKGGE